VKHVKIENDVHATMKNVARDRGLKLERMVDRVIRRGLSSMRVIRLRDPKKVAR
jgi:flagella basal body P-ring formation protein FlgA